MSGPLEFEIQEDENRTETPFLQRPVLVTPRQIPLTQRTVVRFIGLGALLAVPPVAIDLATISPEDINVLLPEALFFYPPVALCAKVACHLAPLAMLTVLASRGATPYWAYSIVVYVEPVFQAANSWNAGLQAWLVFGNVPLISAVQIFLFVRHGFAAMIALRFVFYLFWHLIWGSIRLFLLF